MIATYETLESSVLIDVESRPIQLAVHELEFRLERGWNMIEERQMAGQNVARLEDHWFELLNQYQALLDGAH